VVSYSQSVAPPDPLSRSLTAAALVTTTAFAAPFIYLLAHAASDLGTLWAVITSEDAFSSLVRTVALSATVATSAALVGTASAWLVVRTDVAARALCRVLLPLPLVFPSFIGATVFLAAFAPGGLLEALLTPVGVGRLPRIDGFLGSFIVLTLFTYPYVYLPVLARLRQLPPSIEESARLLGRGGWGTFLSVVLPQLRGAVLAGGLLVFLYVVSDFGVVQLMRYDTLTRLIYSTRLLDRPTSISASLLLGLVALVTIASERAAAGPPAVTAPRGARPLVVPLGRVRHAATAALAALVGAALLAPIGVMTWWVVRAKGVGDLFGGLADLVPAALNTGVVAVVAAGVAVILVAPAAYVTVRRPSRISDVTNAVVVGGFALPGLAIALALVSLTIDAPGLAGALYQTLPLLVFAYVVHFGAQALRTAQVAVASVPKQMQEAGRVLGATRIERFLRIDLPLMAPGLLAGGGLVLLSTMKELPATLLLAPIGFDTLAVKVWSASESALFADASLASLVLVVTSGILTWLLVVKRSDTFI
jgi:iron(III) transport system permease protein